MTVAPSRARGSRSALRYVLPIRDLSHKTIEQQEHNLSAPGQDLEGPLILY